MLRIVSKIMDGRQVIKYRLLDTITGEEMVRDKQQVIDVVRQAQENGVQIIEGVKYRKPYGNAKTGSLFGDTISLKDIPSEQVGLSVYGKQPTMKNPNYDPSQKDTPSVMSDKPQKTIEERFDLIRWAVDGYSMESVVQGCKNMVVLSKAHTRRFTVPPKEVKRLESLVGLSIDLYDTKTKLTHNVVILRHPGGSAEFKAETWTLKIYVKTNQAKKEPVSKEPVYTPVMKEGPDGKMVKHWVLQQPSKVVQDKGQLVLETILGAHNFKKNYNLEMTDAERVEVVDNVFYVLKRHIDNVCKLEM